MHGQEIQNLKNIRNESLETVETELIVYSGTHVSPINVKW